MNSKRKITVAYGDAIGPEIMKATLVAFIVKSMVEY